MDGVKKRLSESVQFRLSCALSLVILVAAVVAGALSFASAFEEAHELQDDVLRQVGRLVARQQDRQRDQWQDQRDDQQQARPSSVAPQTSARLDGAGAKTGAASDETGNGSDDESDDDSDEEARVIVQRLGETNPFAAGVDDGGALPLPATLPDGLRTLDAAGETFRVLVVTGAHGERIAVAQEAGFRNQIARAGALRAVTPLLVLVPVLLLLVARLVRGMFRPIAALAREIDQRDQRDPRGQHAAQALAPVDASAFPVEVRTFAVAINRLLARTGQAMDAQRRFVADAAHELRSPLTALSLQAERLADMDMSTPASERLARLREGIGRAKNLLDQLLSLARAQSAELAGSSTAAGDPPASPLSVQRLYRRVLEDLMPLAEARRIDVGVEGAQDAWVQASELDMSALLGNLVDNALRYTPEGGRVDLSVTVENGCTALRVRDDGPGIAPAERNRVFDPFYRTPGSAQIAPLGSGLGLAIVQTIASRIGARIRLDFADEVAQTGLSVTVRLPVA